MKLLLVALIAVLMLPAVGAHPESAAPSLHPDVERAWHEPQTVEAGTQWQGFLQLRQGHNVTSATYQICNVGDGFCFAPLTPAQNIDDQTFGFDTNDYLANGKPVNWHAGWRVGIHWRLDDGAGNVSWVPRPPPAAQEIVPLEDLYLTFDIPAEPRGLPGPSAVMAVAALVVAAAVRRR